MFSASPEWTDRDCSIPENREIPIQTHTHIHTLKRTGRGDLGLDLLQQPQRMSHHSVAANGAGRNMESCQKKKTPEDSPRSEMCFCLHSNTPTAAATRGTRSNKAEREGSREGVVTLTLSTKGKKKVRQKKAINVSKNSANIKLVELSVWLNGNAIAVCSPFYSILFRSREGQPFFASYRFEDMLQLRFAKHVICICIMLLSVTDNGCS